MNPDCIITEKNLKILCEKIDQYKDALIVSPTSYDSNNNLSFNGGPLVENQKISKILDLKGDTCVQRVLGACMLLRTSDIKQKIFILMKIFFYISRTTIYAEESLVLKNLLYKFMIRVAYMSTE